MAKVKIDMEDLVAWALVRQCAKVNESRLTDEFALLSGGRTSATGAVEAYLALGTRIDGGGANDRRTPADAITVASAIDRLPGQAAALVVMAGRTGQAIDWGEDGVGKWVPVMDRRGRQKKIWQDVDQARGLLGWGWRFDGHTPDDLDYMRLQYWVWWNALIDLRAALEGRLDGWEITGPKRSAEPWNDQPVRILHPVE